MKQEREKILVISSCKPFMSFGTPSFIVNVHIVKTYMSHKSV